MNCRVADLVQLAGEEWWMYGDKIAAFSKLLHHVRSEFLISAAAS